MCIRDRAYDQLNDNKDYSFHLQKVDYKFLEETKPLVLTEEVKTNGKVEEELPF